MVRIAALAERLERAWQGLCGANRRNGAVLLGTMALQQRLNVVTGEYEWVSEIAGY